MNNPFGWLREQYTQRKALWEDKSVADRISAEKHIGTWNKALEILEVAENKWSSECTCKGCIYENDTSEETECGHCKRAYSDCYEGNKKQNQSLKTENNETIRRV